MRIGVHLEALRVGRIGGLETYVRQLIRLLPELAPDVQLVLFCADHNAGSFTADRRVEVRTLDADAFAALDASHLARARLDLWFCPLLVVEPHDPGLPTALTIPDVQHETHPKFFPAAVLHWRRRHYSRSARRADAVLTLSRFSRRHIIDTLGVDAGKVHAIHLDAAPMFAALPTLDRGYLQGVQTRHALPDSFLYYPANNWPHKNHDTLFVARRLAEQTVGRPLPLVLSGAEVDEADSWRQVITRHALDNVQYLGYVPDGDVPGLYALSQALVFPSLFEGFGMPVLEAMRVGCPVICSDLPSLREIAGDAALYFDPERPEELADRITEIHPRVRHSMAAAGRARAEHFSWTDTARATLEVFRNLVPRPDRPVTVTGPPDRRTPLISIVTPSLQQGRFIEATLRSVLEQGYPHLEYWVIDGVSTDGTVEILERYRRRYPDVFRYISEPDGGQAEAVNKGLERVRGEIVGWLNSDDTYQPGTLDAMARAFRDFPASDVIYGRARHVSETDTVIGDYPTQPVFRRDALIHECYLCQPAVFIRRSVIDDGQRLDETLHLCLDYELWIRLADRYRFSFVDRHLANSRVYPQNKSLSQQGAVLREALQVVKRHFGWVPLSWATAWEHFRRDRGDAFFNIRPVSKRAHIAAVWVLVRQNWSAPRHWRRVAGDIEAALIRSWRKRWDGLWPSARRSLAVPRSSLIVDIVVESIRDRPTAAAALEILGDGRRLATLAVNGPGRYACRVGVPRRPDGRAARLTITSDRLLSGDVRTLPPEPFPAVADDGWLEREDTMRLPGDWLAADLAFVVPTAQAGGVLLTFTHQGRVVDRWAVDRPGTYCRRLRVPAEEGSGQTVTLGFSANASLPPDRARGETRALAIRVLEIAEVSLEPDGAEG